MILNKSLKTLIHVKFSTFTFLRSLMSRHFLLPNSDPILWAKIQHDLNSATLNSLEDVKSLILKCQKQVGSNLENRALSFDSLDHLATHVYTENELVEILGKVAKNAAKLDQIMPSGKLPRLCPQTPKINLDREQTMCILSNMLFCTIRKSIQNPYWVTFANWLGDGRTCALVYLRTLIEFFRQSFETNRSDQSDMITFERRQLDKERLETYLNSNSTKFSDLNFEMSGSIGDKSQIEVDFANKDIGFGVTGTQEEILFGKHPELCVSMLFADTMLDDEAIVIQNCRKVAVFEGSFLLNY